MEYSSLKEGTREWDKKLCYGALEMMHDPRDWFQGCSEEVPSCLSQTSRDWEHFQPTHLSCQGPSLRKPWEPRKE